jgi:hypothetical protein
VTALATKQSEAELERLVLRALGQHPRALLLKNEVGLGYRGALLHALRTAIAPFGREAQAAAVDATQRHRITYGLGVGSPDLVGAISGRAVGLELKTAIGVVSPEQERWHAAARRRGTSVWVVRSVGEAVEAVERAERGEMGDV